MNNLSSDNIEAIIQKVLSKDGRTIKEIATLNNISESTIYKWLKRYRDGGTINKFVRKHKTHRSLKLNRCSVTAKSDRI
jgi:transposase